MPILISQTISERMGNNFQCGVLMGANVAMEVAQGQPCESTLASHFGEEYDERIRLLFHTKRFMVQHIQDIYGAEVCGALKNVIALGAGFVDGLDYGGNTKAALLRIGILEIVKFCKVFFDGIEVGTFVQSCGIADLITTCYGGRNRLCAESFARQRRNPDTTPSSTIKSSNEIDIECEKLWQTIEMNVLKGQKLQGTITAKDAYIVLQRKGLLHEFPLISTIYEISFLGKPIEHIVNGITTTS